MLLGDYRNQPIGAFLGNPIRKYSARRVNKCGLLFQCHLFCKAFVDRLFWWLNQSGAIIIRMEKIAMYSSAIPQREFMSNMQLCCRWANWRDTGFLVQVGFCRPWSDGNCWSNNSNQNNTLEVTFERPLQRRWSIRPERPFGRNLFATRMTVARAIIKQRAVCTLLFPSLSNKMILQRCR